ncbi:cell division protein FtsZ [Sphingomonas sp. NSE70-1]|uniref:Cell division protein FtsZ n=1 Tax=Sphingomonas caseinilyticus TaxID=2908205 RepID=A0ABT0RWG8_9SPHN|nr:cell division protein FtsZ [Sphingomonas caseinilyticus]MCL6699372.1 cell division protein FtsZ [Sphingomonas caseinilyticus]
MSIDFIRPEVDELRPRISVIGVGGAGGNAIANMIRSDVQGVQFLVANTDAQALNASEADQRIQLGLKITQGLGAGSRPEIGRAAAEETLEEIERSLDGAHMCFIAAGMGGGTGTGAAPVIAKAARDRGILTVGVVTKPFAFEGSRRMRSAESGIEELQKHVDTLIVIPNQNLFRLATSETTFKEAFEMADEVLQQGVRGITDLMVMPGLINLDFADVRSVMGEMGKAMMGTGEASGDNRAIEAAEKAISNPLLDGVSMKGAKGVIISITGGDDMRLMEVDEAASHIKELVDPDANIIWGSAFNNDLGGKIRVSVVATGIEAEAAVQPTQGKVFTFPTAGRPAAAPTPAPIITPAPEPTAEEAPLDLTSDDEATDELLLGNDDILADPVMGTPIAPPIDEEEAEIEPIEEAKPAAAAGGTLFERMSNIARGAAQAKVEEEPVPGFRREPLDIPRFLNRQNNQ